MSAVPNNRDGSQNPAIVIDNAAQSPPPPTGSGSPPSDRESGQTFVPDSSLDNGNLLAPNGRPRAESAASIAPTIAPSSSAPEQASHVTADEIFANPDPFVHTSDTAYLYQRQSTEFAFNPGQFHEMLLRKDLTAFWACGGIAGLEAGLRTDRVRGLDPNENEISGSISFQEAVAVAGDGHYKPTSSVPGADLSRQPSRLAEVALSKKEKKAAKKDKKKFDPTTVTPEMVCDFDKGFSSRKKAFSNNRLPERSSKSIWELIWMACQDKIIIILAVAAVVSLGLGFYEAFGQTHAPGEPKIEYVEGIAIIVAILIVVLVGALNDWQKERKFAELNRKKKTRKVNITRGGSRITVDSYDILVGDVVALEVGDVIFADGIVITSNGLTCDESALTGESDLKLKTTGEAAYDAIMSHQDLKKVDPFLLSGTQVKDGSGSLLVLATGIYSQNGKIMMELVDEPQNTPLQDKLERLAGLIAKFAFAAAGILGIVLFIRYFKELPGSPLSKAELVQKAVDIIIVCITVVVVAVPEGLPLAVTLALAFATSRMLSDNNLVRDLQSCETMGNASAICSDKTGTLTQNEMLLVRARFCTVNYVRTIDEPTEEADTATTADERAAKKTTSTTETHDNPEKQPAPATDGQSKGKFEDICSAARELLVQSIIINSAANAVDTHKKRTNTMMSEHAEAKSPGFLASLLGSKTKEAKKADEAKSPRSKTDKIEFTGTKTDQALVKFAIEHFDVGNLEDVRAQYTVVKTYPFSSERKCSGAVIRLPDGQYRLLVKGASEKILENCTHRIGNIASSHNVLEPVPITERPEDSNPPGFRQTQQTIIEEMADQSLRTIGIAYRDFAEWTDPDETVSVLDLLSGSTLIGIVGIQDPLRPGVAAAVRDCQSAGVVVRMVTGDNARTARAIALDCGILHKGDTDAIVMEGPDFAKLSDQEVDKIVTKIRVIARSSPNDKKKLVNALQRREEIVAVTGDGTNDAPALKAANIGFSMGIAGTDVAKEASDIILLDDNFASIVKALLWGRAVNDAVKKFLQFQLTVNVTAVLLTFITAVASPNQTSVLTAVQLLWVNLIMDTLAALALATDPPTRSLLNRPPDRKRSSLITGPMTKMILFQSIFQLTVTLVLFFAGKSILQYTDSKEDQKSLATLVFNTFVWMQIFNQLNSRQIGHKLHPHQAHTRSKYADLNIFEGITHNKFFVLIFLLMIGGQVLIIFVGSDAFSVVRLTGVEWAISIVLGFLSIPIGLIIRLLPFPDIEFDAPAPAANNADGDVEKQAEPARTFRSRFRGNKFRTLFSRHREPGPYHPSNALAAAGRAATSPAGSFPPPLTHRSRNAATL